MPMNLRPSWQKVSEVAADTCTKPAVLFVRKNWIWILLHFLKSA